MEGILSKSIGAFLSQPKQQAPEEIIQTLCNRLLHSTNLEDRRAAVLGLRGFSRDYQEVAITVEDEGGWCSDIGC
jgi:hypothetical protein